jgi:hypothetical protein
MKINTAQITKEFCKGKILLFYPATEEEASLVQQKLFDMGYTLAGNNTDPLPLQICISDGLVLRGDEGKFFYNPAEKSREEGLLWWWYQFDKTGTDLAALPQELSPETVSDFFKPERWAGRIREMQHHWEKLPAPLKKDFSFAAALTEARQKTAAQKPGGGIILKRKP